MAIQLSAEDIRKIRAAGKEQLCFQLAQLAGKGRIAFSGVSEMLKAATEAGCFDSSKEEGSK
jgi:hypothetical protein